MALDVSGLPPGSRADQQLFLPNAGVANQSYKVWRKPRGVTMVYMLAVSGGGGGGGGFSRTAGTAGGGGAGGACSGLSRFLCPALFLPDTLYVIVGQGGAGGAASGNGVAGLNSFVLTSPRTGTPADPHIVIASQANAPGGGGAGLVGAGGTGGSVPTVATTRPINTFGEWFSIVGLVGGAGGAQTGALGTNITCWATIPTSPGAGGGGSTGANFAGGDQRAANLSDFGSQGYFVTGSNGIFQGGTGTGSDKHGGGGLRRLTPFFNTGGTGGASFDGGVAGNGGPGGFGCGGGGGGAGTTGGLGGVGGDGLVLIIAW